MTKKFNFSFAFSLSLVLNQLLSPQPSVIHFRMGFDSFRITVYIDTLFIIATDEILIDAENIIYFHFLSKFEFPFLKRKDDIMSIVHSTATMIASIIPVRAFTTLLLPTLEITPLRVITPPRV